MRAAPDGHTLLMVLAEHVNATLFDKLNFDFVRDIAPVASITRAPSLVVVNPVGSRQNRPGVHRLRQSQSRQAQHGIVRHRNLGPPCR